MKKRSKTYDIIIYISLFLAFVCVVISVIDNEENLSNYEESNKEKEKSNPVIEENPIIENEPSKEEPNELQEIDKKSIVKKYLDEIMDRVITDETIPYNMIKTWESYEVLNVIFERQIIEYYYSYRIDLKITGNNIITPSNKNEELSTSEYTIITLRANILKSGKQKGYIVKAIENPNEM